MPEEAPVKTTPYRDGPYLVRGPFTMVDQDGNEIEVRRRVVALCRCGRSQTRPFCDGTHKAIQFRAERQPRAGRALGDPSGRQQGSAQREALRSPGSPASELGDADRGKGGGEQAAAFTAAKEPGGHRQDAEKGRETKRHRKVVVSLPHPLREEVGGARGLALYVEVKGG